MLCYGCEVWEFSKNKEIEQIHLKFCKSLLKVKNTACTMSVYGELSRYPLFINRYVRIAKYWCKIIDSNNIIVNKLYSILLDDMTRGKCNWASSVKQLLCKAGSTHVWETVGQPQ